MLAGGPIPMTQFAATRAEVQSRFSPAALKRLAGG
jgi:hypothetical protein